MDFLFTILKECNILSDILWLVARVRNASVLAHIVLLWFGWMPWVSMRVEALGFHANQWRYIMCVGTGVRLILVHPLEE